jgi:hypothetical protein
MEPSSIQRNYSNLNETSFYVPTHSIILLLSFSSSFLSNVWCFLTDSCNRHLTSKQNDIALIKQEALSVRTIRICFVLEKVVLQHKIGIYSYLVHGSLLNTKHGFQKGL